MGVTGLWSVVEGDLKPTRLEVLENKKLAVDASIWIHQFIKAMRDKSGNEIENGHIIGFYRRICKLMHYRILPIFVFDGIPPEIKQKTISQRKLRQHNQERRAKQLAEKLLSSKLKAHLLEEAISSNSSSKNNQKSNNKSKIKKNTPDSGKKRNRDDFELPADNNIKVHGTILAKQDKKGFDIRLPTLEEAEAAEYWGKIISERKTISGYDAGVFDFTSPNGSASEKKSDTIPNKKILEEEFEKFTDIVDLDNKQFLELPFETQISLLKELTQHSRQTSFKRLKKMIEGSKTAMDFSQMQIENLMTRNKLMQNYMEISGARHRVMSLKNNNKMTVNSVASQRGVKYVLIRSEEPGGGWKLSAPKKDKYSDSSDSEKGTQIKPKNSEFIELSDSDSEFKPSNEFSFDHLSQTNPTKNVILDDMFDITKSEENSINNSKLDIDSFENIDSVENFISEILEENDVINKDLGSVDVDIKFNIISSSEDEDFEDVLIPYHSDTESRVIPTHNNNKDEKMVGIDKDSVKSPTSNAQVDVLSDNKDQTANSGLPHKNTFSGFSDSDSDSDLETNNDSSLILNVLNAEKKYSDSNFFKVDEKTPIQLSNPEGYKSNLLKKFGETKLFKSNGLDLNSTGLQEEKNNFEDMKNPENFETSSSLRLRNSQTNNTSSNLVGDVFCDSKAEVSYIDHQDDQAILLKESQDTDVSESKPKTSSVDHNSINLKVKQNDDINIKETKESQKSAIEKKEDFPKESQTNSTSLQSHPQESKESNLENEIKTDVNNPKNGISSTDEKNTSEINIVSEAEGETNTEQTDDPFKTPAKAKITTSKSGDSTGGYDSYKSDYSGNLELAFRRKSFSPFTPKSVESMLSENSIEIKDFMTPSKSSFGHKSDIEKENLRAEFLEISKLNQTFVEKQIEEQTSELYKARRDASEITTSLLDDIRTLLNIFNIPYITAPAEAEASCAQLEMEKLVDGIITDDSDVLLFGSNKVYRNFFNQEKTVLGYTRNTFSQIELIFFAYFLGSDYTIGVNGIGPVTVTVIFSYFGTKKNAKLVSKYTNMEELETEQPLQESSQKPSNDILDAILEVDENSNIKAQKLLSLLKYFQTFIEMSKNKTILFKKNAPKNLKKLAKMSTRIDLPPDFPDIKIVKAYLKPAVFDVYVTDQTRNRSINLNNKNVHEKNSKIKFDWGIPDLDLLQTFMFEKVGWNEDKVSAAIIPLIKAKIEQKQRSMSGKSNQTTLLNSVLFGTSEKKGTTANNSKTMQLNQKASSSRSTPSWFQ
ncbi:hypothetical protein BB558_007564 [Smittium angustum]|uniref:XPG-I domain-containing protein n=1 Tax=Smittium angustum TaxID=133377 RepID=A0A2U1IUR6_SMIAN|nr:hypothetical protein BB558_007564 [Smittium angustum]